MTTTKQVGTDVLPEVLDLCIKYCDGQAYGLLLVWLSAVSHILHALNS